MAIAGGSEGTWRGSPIDFGFLGNLINKTAKKEI
jgi:hypothetical protein